MHELSITQSILDISLDKAKAAQAYKINKISLVIGELTGFVNECVQFYFDFLSKDSIADGATLNFKLVAGELRCRKCSTTFNPKDIMWVCPICQSRSVEVIGGRELYIESIEVETNGDKSPTKYSGS